MTIRPLGQPDVTPVAEFLNTCWRASYSGILEQSFLDAMTTTTRSQIVRRHLSAGMRGTVAVDEDGQLLGVSMYGPSHFVSLDEAGEIDMLYVHPHRLGTGLGHRLLTQAEVALMAAGYQQLCLDVFSANHQAVAFYTRHGYRVVDHKIDHIEGGEYPLDIMVKQIAAVPS